MTTVAARRRYLPDFDFRSPDRLERLPGALAAAAHQLHACGERSLYRQPSHDSGADNTDAVAPCDLGARYSLRCDHSQSLSCMARNLGIRKSTCKP